MTLELLRCPNCAAQVAFTAGAQLTTCSHCGAQVAFGATAPAGAVLDETIFLKALPTVAIEIVKAGTALPTTHLETIASRDEGQTSLHVDLQAGHDSNPVGNRDLASVEYTLQNKPKFRGAPVAQLEIRVAQNGDVELAVREEGTTNTRHYTGFRVRTR